MCRVPVVVTVSGAEGRALLALVEVAVVDRIDALREGAIAAYKAGRDVGAEAAMDDFRLEALDLVRSPLVGVYRDLVDVVPAAEADDPDQAAAVDEGG